MSNYRTCDFRAQFGCFWPKRRHDLVLEILKNTKFKKINDKSKIKIGNDLFSFDTNSNSDGYATLGFISIDGMTIYHSQKVEKDGIVTLPFTKDKLSQKETKHVESISEIADIYSLLVREFTARKIPTSGLRRGWHVVFDGWDVSLCGEPISDNIK